MKLFISLLLSFCLLQGCNQGPEEGKLKVELQTRDQGVEVLIDGQPFTTYRYDSSLEKPVLYPIHAPDGSLVNRGFPLEPRARERSDHPHHLGLWFNYGDVNGYDFWNNSYAVEAERKAHYGRIVHREVVRAESLDDGAELEVKMDWLAPDTDESSRLLEEHTVYRFLGREGCYIVDRLTSLRALADTVVFQDNKEGMLAIRVDRSFEHPSDRAVKYTDASGRVSEVAVLDNEGANGWYRNSEGDEGGDAWGKNARWVKLRGSKGSDTCSLVLMDHPSNINYPACWHARGYGLFSINNLGRQVYNPELDFFRLELKAGEELHFRHRFLLAAGDLSDAEIETYFREFTQSDKP